MKFIYEGRVLITSGSDVLLNKLHFSWGDLFERALCAPFCLDMLRLRVDQAGLLAAWRWCKTMSWRTCDIAGKRHSLFFSEENHEPLWPAPSDSLPRILIRISDPPAFGHKIFWRSKLNTQTLIKVSNGEGRKASCNHEITTIYGQQCSTTCKNHLVHRH